ncbi:delta-1-Pyrroline-5-carboxylate dehydrogenase 1 [Dermatophagoides farinae]|uniref:Multifunctional fusion protein n=1 Tax=Dermatophagoides farinae TaxID=6954 RepID=A0A922HL39_DERFA|nr:delta-1-pyrroline-5-carboxylate dehydrogenase, mitochondrial-like [Dermatophagoides farinae]KAH7643955.1 delta-1-pyrroline-5-carboxylate dehydrogenase [Dermatophagoides farinae]KAH9496992.1 hypothetical protein DERF_013011 [Dermatophagoides farinae]
MYCQRYLSTIVSTQRTICSSSSLSSSLIGQNFRFNVIETAKLVSNVRGLSSQSPVFIPPTIKSCHVENEPMFAYQPGSKERSELEQRIKHYLGTVTEIPLVIGGEEITTSNVETQLVPFDHGHILAKYHVATAELAKQAIEKSLAKNLEWSQTDVNHRIECLLKAAELASGKYRQDLNAATVLGQGKTFAQAEIDSAAELADFFRFNAHYLEQIYRYQPLSPSPSEIRNAFRIRGLEGFVAAISPFNFTAIAANLSSAPALAGNAVVWKPSPNALLSNWIVYKILREANFAPGVISFLPSTPETFSQNVIASPDLAAVNFTGSVATFRAIWKTVAANLDSNKTFPRLVGECGGKDFHFIHPSADLDTVIAQTIRAAFEYSGQKCSACSRLYVPKSIWPKIKDRLVEITASLKVGSPLESDTYLSAVINEASWDRNTSFLNHAKQNSTNHKILVGGQSDKGKGFFVQPTIIETTDPRSKLMTTEIFGPILTVYVFDDDKIDETLDLVDKSTPYGLTGAIFGQDREFLLKATEKLKFAAGNFYINDKCTGAVVAQQPFGGARLSGTNDKAGAPQYLFRWISPQNIKETFVPLPNWK